ncbi:MAG: hypothetical protein APF76_10290 [Desulfitibacter sp. BRH_c19]|nr:MAG: hypothetical protein APF76_10290 [Desulfitibacter sp. BRH_c19]
MAQSIVTIKGTPKCLVIHIDTKYDFADIKSALRKHINHANGFFVDAKYRFQTSPGSLTNEQYIILEQVCSECGLIPIPSSETTVPENNTSGDEQKGLEMILGVSDDELEQQSHFISKNIRNGEKLSFKGNVILLGDINPGSEIVASGNIVVMGSVKGMVHAGAEGDLNSFIIASILDPLQIRIGKLIACKPEKNTSIKKHTPEIARVDNNQIVVLPYLTGALAQIS